MAHSIKYLKENVQIKYQLLSRDDAGQPIERICTLGELEDLPVEERNEIVSLVLFPMSKSGSAHTFSTIETEVENLIHDLPNLRNLATSSQFVNVDTDDIKANGCPSLARHIRIQSTRDAKVRDFPFTKGIHNKTIRNRRTEWEYLCSLVSGSKETCEILDVYDSYIFPKETKEK